MKFYITNLKKENIFNVPEGYFENLPGRLTEKIAESPTEKKTLSDELPLADYTVLSSLAKSNFTLPTGYFEKLPARIMQKIGTQSDIRHLDFTAIDLAFIADESIFKTPENYFETLTARIMAKAASGEKREALDFTALEESSELGILANLPKQNIFKTPENYFETLTLNIESQTEIQSGSAVSETEITPSMALQPETKTLRLIPNWLKYSVSVAASLVLVNVGIYFYNNNTQEIAVKPCTDRLLCDVSDAELNRYFQDHRLHDELLMEVEQEQNTPKSQIQPEEELSKPIDLTEEEILNEIDM